MKAFWIDRETNTAKVVETNGKLDDLYRMCHCSCIDVAVREVCGIPLNFVVDDEGLLVQNPVASVFDTSGNPLLAGSVVVFGYDNEWGELASLTGKQIEALMNRSGMVMMNDLTMRTVLLADAWE